MRQWAPEIDGGDDWRDTAVEVVSPEAAERLRTTVDDASSSTSGRSWSGWDDGHMALLENAPSSRRGRRIRRAYLWAIRNAKKSIDITCAYFAPRPLFLRALAAAARRGVRVRLLVPLRSDVELARYASLPWLRWLARREVTVFAYTGGILHAKTAVIDDDWCTVGSHNLEGLSWAWNLECNVAARRPPLAGQLTTLFEQDLTCAVRWSGARSLGEGLVPDSFRRWYSRG